MDGIVLIILISLIAFLYSTVGHGGASGYIALMVLLGMPQEELRPLALLLNMLVSGIAFGLFFQSGFFNKKLFLSLIALSIPMAFLGAMIDLPQQAFRIVLGICLLISVSRVVLPEFPEGHMTRAMPNSLALIIGAVIGCVSGMIGIGGGILLSPVLIIGRWASVRETAAIAAPFIFLNSVAGLIGTGITPSMFPENTPAWLVAAAVGGLIGSLSGSRHFNSRILRYFLATVLVVAAGKLFIS